MIKKYVVNGKMTKKAIKELAKRMYGVTTDKNGKDVYPDYCHRCRFTSYFDGTVTCENEKSESYQSRVRSWDTACKEYQERSNL